MGLPSRCWISKAFCAQNKESDPKTRWMPPFCAAHWMYCGHRNPRCEMSRTIRPDRTKIRLFAIWGWTEVFGTVRILLCSVQNLVGLVCSDSVPFYAKLGWICNQSRPSNAGEMGCVGTSLRLNQSKRKCHRLQFGHCGQRVLSRLGPLCGLEQSRDRNSCRTAVFRYGERVLSTQTGHLRPFRAERI